MESAIQLKQDQFESLVNAITALLDSNDLLQRKVTALHTRLDALEQNNALRMAPLDSFHSRVTAMEHQFTTLTDRLAEADERLISTVYAVGRQSQPQQQATIEIPESAQMTAARAALANALNSARGQS